MQTEPFSLLDPIPPLVEAIDAAFKPMFCSLITLRHHVEGEVRLGESGVMSMHRIIPGGVELWMKNAKTIVIPFPFAVTVDKGKIVFDYNIDLLLEPSLVRSAFITRHARHSSKYLNTKLSIEASDTGSR